MSEASVTITVTATGEVRDAAGNLVDTPTLVGTTKVTPEQARALGLDVDTTHEGDQP